MKNKTTSPKAAAIITIHSPGKMSKKGRDQIAKWLKNTAEDLSKLGKDYTNGRFTARYLY